ncbi:hypothetical protein CW714_05295, partial [Methanophagales archaeon]
RYVKVRRPGVMMKGTKAVAGMNIKRLVYGICVAFVLCAFVGVSVAFARTIYVPDDYEKIQWAVDHASAGDTIIVRDGIYYESITVSKQLTIKSENGPANCIVNGTGSDVFTLEADGIRIEGFTITGGGHGIYIRSNKNTIINNNICSNDDAGIYLSNNNSISENNISNNDVGIYLLYSNKNSISENDISSNNDGICLKNSNNNIISENNISSNNYDGIYLWDSNENMIRKNKFINDGIYVRYSYGNIVENNTVNGKPLFYLEGESDEFIDNAGQVILVKCKNITVMNSELTNTNVGIELWQSDNCLISNNNISNNWGISIYEGGISLYESNNNIISENNISSNNWFGISLWYSSDNIIYMNNFINNTESVYSFDSTNIWNSTSQMTYTYEGRTYTNYLGNYWSDYKGSDADEDGIGDTPYSIDGDKDNYPLMERFENYFGGVEEEYNPKVSVPPYAPFAEYGHVGTNLTFIIKVENKGTKEDTIDLTARPYYPALLDIYLSKDSVTLSPSESELIYLNVTVKSKSYNPITITATSEGDDTKVSSCEVKTGGPTPLNPLYFSFWFDTKGHALAFNAPEYVKLNEISQPEEKKELEIVFDPKSSQTGIREFYVEITDETSGETVKIPIKLNPDYNIIATDFDVSEDGYNFPNYGKIIVIPNLIEIGGRCYPMSETSALYFIGAIELPKDVKSVYTMQEEKAKKVIDSYFWAHFLDNLKIGMHVGLDPINEQNEYQKLKDNLTKGEPMMLIMAKPTVIPGVHAYIHAVLAYKIIEIGDTAYILIYENEIPYSITNFPIAFPCAVFNMTSGEFNYADSFTKFVVQKPNPYPKPDTTTLAIECPVNATITDQYGRIIADNGTNEIPNASMIITNETKVFYLPADLTYSVDIDAYDTGTFNFTRVSPVGNDISITKFEDISVTESTKVSVEIVPNVTNYTMSIDYNGDGKIDEEKSPDVSETIVIIEENIFDTGAPENPYPSISGTFNGTITPYKTIIVKNLYTYPCEGTGGHTEYVRIYN